MKNVHICCLPTLLIFLHIEHICSFFVVFFSATIDGRNLICGHKLHIGTPYRGKCFLTRQIPTSCLPKSGGHTKMCCTNFEYSKVSLEAVNKPFYRFSQYMCNSVDVVKNM
jgi:hypothetical protein